MPGSNPKRLYRDLGSVFAVKAIIFALGLAIFGLGVAAMLCGYGIVMGLRSFIVSSTAVSAAIWISRLWDMTGGRKAE